MKTLGLDLEVLEVKCIEFGEKTAFSNGLLTICKEELLAHIQSDEMKSIKVDIALPGESVRIIPVKDVVEPRAKVENGEFFPGVLAPIYKEGADNWGEGRTKVLRGCGVVTTGRIVFYQEGIIDMSGPGAEYTIYSKLCNVVISSEPDDKLDHLQHEKAVRMLGLKAANYLACAVREAKADYVEHYELQDVSPELPRVGIAYLTLAQGLLHDNYIYGKNPQQFHPMLLSPNEFMDGAVVSGNCVTACDKNTTYDHLNHPVIKRLYELHGTELNFVGALTSPISPILSDKERCAAGLVNLARHLKLDGLIVVEEGGGNPESDVMMICNSAERAGIKTVLMVHENCGKNGAAQGITLVSDAANAVVSAGNVNEIVQLPPMEKVFGDMGALELLSGAPENPLKEDGSITASITILMDAASNIGVSRLGVANY